MTYTDPLQDDVIVTWDLPVAVDNVDTNVVVVQTEGPAPGSSLPSGSYLVSYTAVDGAGNQADPCVFNIIVQRRFAFLAPYSERA